MESASTFLILEKSGDYELIDSGDGMKLERFSERILARPETQAIWKKSLGIDVWNTADAVYARKGTTGTWEIKREIEGGTKEFWDFSILDLKFNLKLLPSKHLGVFPEQAIQWQWVEEKIKNAGRKISVLNLFAYTGGASLSCARAGAEVCHIDSSEFVVETANKNLKNSGLEDSKVRFFVDDVRKFVEREIKRGNKYDVIIMDPPVYGKGNLKLGSKVWELEKDLVPLITRLEKVLSNDPLAVVFNGYASNFTHITYKQVLEPLVKNFKGKLESGELGIKERSGKILPAGIFARWSK